MKLVFKSFVLLAISFALAFGVSFGDEFYDIKDTNQRKKEFIDKLIPMIEQANEDILKERIVVDHFFQKVEKVGMEGINLQEKLAMESLAEKYRINSIENKAMFERRVAPVPISLAVAQAALESGWGTSRFAKEANNIFGQWTWTTDDKLGMIPANRVPGKTHRIKIFSTLQESVNDYILNLNRHDAYRGFRNLRLQTQDSFNGLRAADTMLRYSEIGQKYVGMIKQVINANKLLKLDDSYKEALQNNNTKTLRPLS